LLLAAAVEPVVAQEASTIQLGMTREQVHEAWGEPDWVDNPANVLKEMALFLGDEEEAAEAEQMPDAPFENGEETFSFTLGDDPWEAEVAYRADLSSGVVVPRVVEVKMSPARPVTLQDALADLSEAWALCADNCDAVGILETAAARIVVYPLSPSAEQSSAARGAASWWKPTEQTVYTWVPSLQFTWEGQTQHSDVRGVSIDWLQKPINTIRLCPANLDHERRMASQRPDQARLDPLGTWRP